MARCGFAPPRVAAVEAAQVRKRCGFDRDTHGRKSGFLDSGLDAARDLLRRLLFEFALEGGGAHIADSDRKSALQEFLQGRGRPPAEYRLAREEGPDHQKLFHIEVWSLGECLASGDGSTKKEAEQKAARAALERLEHAGTRD